MSRLNDLRTMRDFLDREIACEISREIDALRSDPLMLRVCELYNVGVDEVLLGLRAHNVTRVRHAATWLLNRRGMSMRTLCRLFGYSSPSSVHKAIHRVESDLAMKSMLQTLEVVPA